MNKEWNWDQKNKTGWNGNTHYKKKIRFTKLFWGLLLILMGIFLVVSKMGLVTGISVWSVFFTVIFAALLIRGLIKRNFASIFFSIAFLCIIYDDLLGITALTPWTVLLTALLLSVGMEILFHKRGNYRKYVQFVNKDTIDSENITDSGKGVHVNINLNDENDSKEQESYDEDYDGQSMYGEKIYQSNSFCTRSKYINPETFERGMLENSFGSMNVFFENVPTRKKEGFLDVENSFGEMNIYIPSSWAVDLMMEDSFGNGSDIKGHSDGSRSFLLHVRGSSSFGSVHIIYQ